VPVGGRIVRFDGLGMYSPSSVHVSVAGLKRVGRVSPAISKRWGGESLCTPATRGREWLEQRTEGSGGEPDIRGVGGVEGVGDDGAASKASEVLMWCQRRQRPWGQWRRRRRECMWGVWEVQKKELARTEQKDVEIGEL
jgi:hypothetical protein